MINYYLLTKPGIILGNLMTVASAFVFASNADINFYLLFTTLIGISFVMASGCVFNNYIDRAIDKKMARTQNRPLPQGLISNYRAICFALLLGIVGNVILFFYTNLLATLIADLGFFIYVILYSLWKCHTIYGTAIGSIAGAAPPIVGYAAVTETIDVAAIILFAIMILWQMPHFFSIAIYRLEDYKAAAIPVLPVKKGILATKLRMLLYIIAFSIASSLLTFFGYTSYIYLIIAVFLSVTWMWRCIKGFKCVDHDETLWAKSMFRHSLLVVTLLFASIAILS